MKVKINGKLDKFYKEIDGKEFEVDKIDINGYIFIDDPANERMSYAIPKENYEIIADNKVEKHQSVAELEYNILIAQNQKQEIIIDALITHIKEKINGL